MRLSIGLSLLLLTVGLRASPLTDRVISAIEIAESSGRPGVIGDGGMAWGALQIHPIMLRECRRLGGPRYSMLEMMNPIKARRVAQAVLSHYENHIRSRIHREPSAKSLAFCWNGGLAAWTRAYHPRGDSKQDMLERYWRKVETALR